MIFLPLMSLFYYSRVTLVLLACACTTEAQSTISKSTWRGLPAFTQSDGRCEAVVVPGLGGRVVSFGLIGGRNFIWSGPAGVEQQPPTLAWGGDKTYIGPHTMWSLTLPRTWPPPSPDAAEHSVEMLGDGRLRTTSPPWEAYDGARIVREQGFDARGDFVITHTITKVPGSRAIGAVWTITQTVPATSFYLSLIHI